MLKTYAALAALLALGAAPARAAVEQYPIDPTHTFPSLEFSHMGISVWRGKFEKTRGTITLDRAARTGAVDVVIDTASIDFGLEAMNEHAVKDEWFKVATFPTASYKGRLNFAGDRPQSVDGELTFRGVTRPVKLTISNFNCIPHPFYKREVCGADAEGQLFWSDFGMRKYGEGDADKVLLRIQVEGMKPE